MRFVEVVARLSDLCEIKTNFPKADFWLIRRGDKKKVGKPTREFSSEAIGIKILAKEIVLPDYLYYWFEYLHMNRVFEQIAHGTTRLVNIKLSDVANIPASFAAKIVIDDDEEKEEEKELAET